jgi:transposase
MIFMRSKEKQIAIRLRMVRYAQQHGIKPTAAYYHCSKNTVKTWLYRFEKQGTGGLQNNSRAPHYCPHKTPLAEEELIIAKRNEASCFGPKRLKWFNPSIKASEAAIYRILKEKNLLRKNRKKYKRKQDLRAIKAQYASLTHNQEDVKHLYDIPFYWQQMTVLHLPRYEYTIRDVKSGLTIMAFANAYSEQYSTILTECFLTHLRSFGIESKNVNIQTDNGSEFGAKKRNIHTPGFVNTIMMEFGAHHTYIPPGCSNANADVESFHASVESEFFDLESFASKKDFFRRAQAYQYFYNFVRPNFSKGGKTPLQIILEDWPKISPAVLHFPVYDLDALFRQKMETSGGQHVHKLPELFLCRTHFFIDTFFDFFKTVKSFFCKSLI